MISLAMIRQEAAARRRRVVYLWASVMIAALLGIILALVAIALDDDPSQECRDAGGVPLATADDQVACLDPDAVKFGPR